MGGIRVIPTCDSRPSHTSSGKKLFLTQDPEGGRERARSFQEDHDGEEGRKKRRGGGEEKSHPKPESVQNETAAIDLSSPLISLAL